MLIDGGGVTLGYPRTPTEGGFGDEKFVIPTDEDTNSKKKKKNFSVLLFSFYLDIP